MTTNNTSAILTNIFATLTNIGLDDLIVDAYGFSYGPEVEAEDTLDLDQPYPAAKVPLMHRALLAKAAPKQPGDVPEPEFRLFAGDQEVAHYSAPLAAAWNPELEWVEGVQPDPNLPITKVVFKIKRREQRRHELEGISLVQLCATAPERRQALAPYKRGETPILNFFITQDGKEIGRVDSDSQFHYTAAPDLRTALGWAMATDGGRGRSLKFDLEVVTRDLVTDVIKTLHPYAISQRYFFEGWHPAMNKAFKAVGGSRYSDALSFSNLLWRILTREYLGEEHPGYGFSH